MDNFKEVWENAMKKARENFEPEEAVKSQLNTYNNVITTWCYELYSSFITKGFDRQEALMLTMKMLEVIAKSMKAE